MAENKYLASAEELDIEKTFECGQCFRWNADSNGVYSGVAYSYPAFVWTEEGNVFIRSDGPLELWRDYFDLDRDYSAACRSFHGGEYLDACIAAGQGIRILRQEPWEALCSFIISQCNNITRIKGIVERLCESFGAPLELDGKTFFGFPSPEKICSLDDGALDILRCGYRAPYILSAAAEVAAGSLDLKSLQSCSAEKARSRLMELKGVGSKVANCVVLFGLHHMEAFPIDVWIRRALKEHFPADFDPRTLGGYAGLAQQYIFYYARNLGK